MARRYTQGLYQVQRSFIFGILFLWPLLSLGQGEGDPQLGERLYVEGLLASGDRVNALTQGDVPISGKFSCGDCHRKSGYGASEGGVYVLPITAKSLYEPRELNRAQNFTKLFKEDQSKLFWARMRSPRMRPAYTDATLAQVIRTGIDPSGRDLHPLMPRYQIPDQDMRNVVAYLKQLSVTADPGVDERKFYFAVVIAGKVDKAKREAVLTTTHQFAKWMNLETSGNARNPAFSPHYRSDFIKSARAWDVAVWELDGPPETWKRQLAAYYKERPVFAVIGGVVEGPWSPFQRFCEEEKLPCLFPHTDLPEKDGAHYSVHWTRGLALEAELIGHYLQQSSLSTSPSATPPSIRVLQIYVDGAFGNIPADALASRLGAPPFEVEKRSFSDIASLERELNRAISASKPYDVLVLWPGEYTEAIVQWLLAKPRNPVPRIFFPYKALENTLPKLPDWLLDRLYFSYPYDHPDAYHPNAFRVRSWMNSQGIKISHPNIQLSTYFSLNVLQYSLEEMVERFSREYLLENIERIVESAANPGVYPYLSLGPGQRFASRGGYIVKLSAAKRLIPVNSWVIPDKAVKRVSDQHLAVPLSAK